MREAFVVRHRATNADTADKEAEAAYLDFVTRVRPEAQALTLRLQAKLLGVKGFLEAEHVEMLRRPKIPISLDTCQERFISLSVRGSPIPTRDR